MTFTTKLQLVGISAAVFLAVWQFQRHTRQSRELASVDAQLKARNQEFESRRAERAAAEERNRELIEAERRAGNQTLIALMRERAAATAESDTFRPHSVGNALANVLESPEQQTIDREYIRNEMRANMGQFFKLINLSPEKIEQYIDLQIDVERRKAGRMSALLRGTMSVAEALRGRDAEYVDEESRRREILGAEGYAFLQSIADGMRADEAGRLLKIIQDNLGANSLNSEQSDHLKKLIKDGIAGLNMDDTDLFRSPDDWAQFYDRHQQAILAQAAAFLTPAQFDALRTLAAQDLAQKRDEVIFKRKSLGIK